MLMATFAMAGTAMAKKTYVNGIDLNFPPYGYVDKTGQPAGFDVESMNWIAEKFGFDVKHQPMDWSGIVPALVSGKIDLIASGMSITDERKKVVNFSIPYKVVKQVMVVKNGVDTPAVDFLTTNKRLGVQRGTTAMGWLEENKDKYNYTLVIYDSSPLAVQDMVMGRVDACPMDDNHCRRSSQGQAGQGYRRVRSAQRKLRLCRAQGRQGTAGNDQQGGLRCL